MEWLVTYVRYWQRSDAAVVSVQYKVRLESVIRPSRDMRGGYQLWVFQGLGYGSIQIGLNICAILDAIDRARQEIENQARKHNPRAVPPDQPPGEPDHENKENSKNPPGQGKDRETEDKKSNQISYNVLVDASPGLTGGLQEMCSE